MIHEKEFATPQHFGPSVPTSLAVSSQSKIQRSWIPNLEDLALKKEDIVTVFRSSLSGLALSTINSTATLPCSLAIKPSHLVISSSVPRSQPAQPVVPPCSHVHVPIVRKSNGQ